MSKKHDSANCPTGRACSECIDVCEAKQANGQTGCHVTRRGVHEPTCPRAAGDSRRAWHY